MSSAPQIFHSSSKYGNATTGVLPNLSIQCEAHLTVIYFLSIGSEWLCVPSITGQNVTPLSYNIDLEEIQTVADEHSTTRAVARFAIHTNRIRSTASSATRPFENIS